MSKEAHARSITGAASVVGGATAFSRVLGYVRDAAIAYVFGAGVFSDAFFMAFRISNLLRRLLGEGALTSSFVPIFTEELGRRNGVEIKKLLSSVFTLFFVILVILAVAGVIFSSEIVRFLSPGFTEDPFKFNLTVRLTQFMFPYMVFVGLMAIAMGALNSVRHFAAPAISPVFFNLSIIAAIFLVAPFLDVPVYALAIGVLVGGFFQFAMQVPYLNKFGLTPRPSFFFNDAAIKKIFLLMGPAAFGLGVYQINSFVSLWFSSHLPEGSVSYLYFSSRLMELPIGVFGVAVATAALPSLSEHAAKKDWDGLKSSLSFALRIVNFVTIPATVGLIILSYPIIITLFMRGEFGEAAVSGTAVALYYYAIGLVPVSSARILTSVFYSIKDTTTPVWVAVISLFVNVFFCFILVGPLKHGGLALANSISAVVNAALLLIILRKRFGRFGGKDILTSAVKSLAASVVMGAVMFPVFFYTGLDVKHKWMNLIVVPIAVAAGIGVYVFASRIFKSKETAFLKDFLSKRG